MEERFTFFWSGPFSQWFPSPFTLDGVSFNTAEQYMMAGKARLFEDEEMLAEILAADHPGRQKALGRLIRNFDDRTWKAHARDIVYRGNRGKFTSDPVLLETLLASRGTTLVEASPKDRLWGIGLAANDPRARNRTRWRGTNWLGETLTRLREDLLAGRAAEPSR